MNDQYKEKNIYQWTKNPAGAVYVKKAEMGSEEFFLENEKYRYADFEWLKKLLNTWDVKNKKVLEIGVGMGADHLQLAKGGAILTGVDVTPKSIELTGKNLNFFGFKSDLLLADATELPFMDNTFDCVYSCGVIHHIPDIQKAVDEIYRVLKPKGESLILIYNKFSVFYIVRIIFFDMIFKIGFLRISLKKRMSKIEYSDAEGDAYVKVFSKRQARKLFNKFKEVDICSDHLKEKQIPFFSGRRSDEIKRILFPQSFLNKLSKKFGWFLIIKAKK